MRKEYIIYALIALLGASLFGCASDPPETENLVAPSQLTQSFKITALTSYKLKGTFNKEGEVGILPGTYSIEKENSLGQFFVGKLPSVWWLLSDEAVVTKGGVWVSRDPSISPRIYYYYVNLIRRPTLAGC